MRNYYVYALMALVLISTSCKKDDDGGGVEINMPPTEVSASSVVTEVLNGSTVQISWEAATDENNDPIVYEVIVNDKIVANKISDTSIEFDANEFIPVNDDNEEKKIASKTNNKAKGVSVELIIKIRAYDDDSAVSKEIEVKKSIQVNRNPEIFEFMNIYFSTFNYNHIDITWTPSIDPDGDVVTYDVYLNDLIINENYVIGSDDQYGSVVYNEDFEQYINDKLIIKVIAKDTSGGQIEITEEFNFTETDVDLGALAAPYNQTFNYTTENDLDERLRFNFTIDTTLNYDFEITEANHDTYMYLYDAAGGLIQSDDDGGNGALSKVVGALSAGSYYLEISSYGGGTGSGTLSMKLQ